MRLVYLKNGVGVLQILYQNMPCLLYYQCCKGIVCKLFPRIKGIVGTKSIPRNTWNSEKNKLFLKLLQK